jgi:hypothetical protein
MFLVVIAQARRVSGRPWTGLAQISHGGLIFNLSRREE